MNRWFSGLSPEFNKLWVGQSVSEFGSRISRGCIPLIAVITLSASPAQLGVLTVAASIPVLVFGLFAGVWVDRLRRRPIMIAMDMARMVTLLTLPAAALTGHLSMELLYLVAAVTGVLTLIFETAYRAYLPSLVEREQIVAANGKLTTSESLAEIGGPALAGVLIQAISAPLAILFDSLSFLFSASCATLIRKPEPAPKPRAQERSVWHEIAEGVRLVAHDPLLRTLALTIGLRSFFGSFYALYDLYGIRDLGLTPSLLGFAIASGGVGGLVGALLSERVQKRFGLSKALIGSFLLSAVIGLLTPLAGGSVALATIMLIIPQLIGDGTMTIFWINQLSLRQMIVPDHLLGRTNASIGFLEQGIAPFGALVAGALATGLGARLTLLIAVLGTLATALWLSRSPVRTVKNDAFETKAPV